MASRNVVYETATGAINAVQIGLEDSVLKPGEARVAVDESIVPGEPRDYTFDGVTFTKKDQAEIDARYQAIEDEAEADRLMAEVGQDMVAKEAKKTPGLSQGVIDELTKKEKK